MSDAPSPTTGLQCPACHIDLLMSEREGVEIDFCPKCRGVWLDRGELDKIIEHAVAEDHQRAGAALPRQGESREGDREDTHREEHHHHHGSEGHHGGHHGYGGFLGRYFDV